MKKIFTLITMAVMAMTAMAEDYKGAMTIQLGDGEPMEQESTISVTESEGKYTLSLADFSFEGYPLGDITLTDLQNEATDGTIHLTAESTVEIPLFEGVPLPLTLDATIDKRNVLKTKISIDVMGAFTVFVDFASTPEVTTYTGELAIDLGADDPTTQSAEIEVMKSNDIYTLTLKDFNFMGILDLGDIQMAGLKNAATDGTLALAYDGMVEVATFGEMPLTLQATIDKADVLNAVIGITVPMVGKVNVTFTSKESTGISSVETETEGSDEVVAILISSKLSGTFQCAQLAAEECEFHDVYFVDSDTASPGEYILIREAVRLREEGISAAEIAAQLDLLKRRIRILAVVDSLKHLHKGGRLPAAVALVGGALGIKPVLSVYEGAVHLADKARGRPGAYVAMFKQLDKMGGIDTNYDHVLVYSSSRLALNPIQQYVTHNLKLPAGHISQIGSVIGTHIGPSAAGIAFVVPPNE